MAITSSSLRAAGQAPMPIRITRPTVFRGRPVDVGDVFLDATGPEASVLIGCGKAERYNPPPATALVREIASAEPRSEIAAAPPARKPGRPKTHV